MLLTFSPIIISKSRFHRIIMKFICRPFLCKVLSGSRPFHIELSGAGFEKPIYFSSNCNILQIQQRKVSTRFERLTAISVHFARLIHSITFLNGVLGCRCNAGDLAGLMGNADKSRWWKSRLNCESCSLTMRKAFRLNFFTFWCHFFCLQRNKSVNS